MTIVGGLGSAGGKANKESVVGSVSLGRNTENTDSGISVLFNSLVST